jgi:membrane fusion protein (multidrug efflux system)
MQRFRRDYARFAVGAGRAACGVRDGLAMGSTRVELESNSVSGAVQATNSNGKFHIPWSIRIGALIVGSLAHAALAQPAKGPGAGPPPAMPVKVVAAKLAPAVDEASAVGTLRADESVVIRPEIAGRISEFRFDEGQGVKKGALLVTLDASEVRAQLASAKAQAQLDAQRLERAEDLRKKNFISAQALDEARSNHARAQASQREVEAKLAKAEIRAPFTGVAGLRQ